MSVYKVETVVEELNHTEGTKTVTDKDGTETVTASDKVAAKRIKVTIERFDADDNSIECTVINNAEGICLLKLDDQSNPEITATEGFITGNKFDLRLIARELHKLMKSRGLLNDPIRDLFSRLHEVADAIDKSEQHEHLCADCAGAEECQLPQAIAYRAERDKVDTMPDRDFDIIDLVEDTETDADNKELDKDLH